MSTGSVLLVAIIVTIVGVLIFNVLVTNLIPSLEQNVLIPLSFLWGFVLSRMVFDELKN